jgi:chlorite dismutase
MSREHFNAAPNTLEGYFVLHQFFRLRWSQLNVLDGNAHMVISDQAISALTGMTEREDGDSALFVQLGHKGDLILIHFRRSLEEIAEAEREIASLRLYEFVEQVNSYLSVIEIGLYEATVRLHQDLKHNGVEPSSQAWREATEAEIRTQRAKMSTRLWSKIPDRRYVCFYPMNKRRSGTDNWYLLPLEERQRLMHEHGLIGRRYAGRVNQVISGSIGFDDWEWGVDLFADDPLVFKHLVYEMRFDESSARYGEFGQFFVGIRVPPPEMRHALGAPSHG